MLREAEFIFCLINAYLARQAVFACSVPKRLQLTKLVSSIEQMVPLELFSDT